jgi:hypothetical protein
MRPTFRENRGQFHKQNNTNNMEYYNIRNRDMGRNDVWDVSRENIFQTELINKQLILVTMVNEII